MKKIIAIAILLIATSAGAATATWTHDGLNGVQGFTLYFWQSSNPTTVWNKSITNGTARSMVIDDNYFMPGVEYSFSMSAFNATGESVRSAPAVKWTRPGASYVTPADKIPTSLYIKPSGVNTIVIDVTP